MRYRAASEGWDKSPSRPIQLPTNTLEMADLVARRERPVDTSNRYPRRAAYACYTEEGNKAAEKCFRLAYQEQFQGHSLWASSTIASFNNWIIALIKLYQYERAEALCREKLQLMEASGKQESSCFVCIQCNLAASLYLSGHLPAAEELFDTIRTRQDMVSNGLAREFFEVLSLVRLTKNDCLVFRESSAKFAGLVPVSDYTNLRDGKYPKTNVLRSSIGSLRKAASFSRSFGQIGARAAALKIDRPVFILKRLFQLDRTLLRATPLGLNSIPASPSLVEEADLLLQHNPAYWSGQQHEPTRSTIPWPLYDVPIPSPSTTHEVDHHSQRYLADVAGLEDEVEPGHAADTVVDWTHVSPERLPINVALHPPSAIRNSFDAAQSLTFRSQQTTTSSQDLDSEDLSLLAVTTWAADRTIRTEMEINALLDGGAVRNLASWEFARAIDAPILSADDVHLTNPDGSDLEHLGRIRVGISFKGPAGTRVETIRCLVVRNLKTALLIGRRIIRKFDLEEASKLPIFGPILLNPRSKKEKRDNTSISNAIAAARKDQEARMVPARKAERALAAATSAKPKTSSIARADSLLGGSDTTSTSARSSMTFSGRSNTISTTTSSPSLRTNSSDSHRPSGFSSVAGTAGLSTASAVSPLLQRNHSGHRRSDAQDRHK